MIKLSVVVPVYGCHNILMSLHEKLTESLMKISKDYEIILVNDSCPGESWNMIQMIAKQDSKVTGINLSRNFGQHYAITAGLDYSKGEWLVVMDCDLQDKPEEIANLYKKTLEGYDIVLARRKARKDRLIKRLSSKLFYKVLGYLTETKQNPEVGNFGIYHKKVVEVIKNMRESSRFFPVLVRWVGFKSTELEVAHDKREEGKSSYNLKKMIKLALDTMIAFSDKPLRLTVKLGFIISFFSFLFALSMIIKRYFFDVPVEGWTSIVVSLWFISGIIITILGMLGLYIGKTFDETKKRPLYIVKEIVNDKKT